MKTFDTYLEEYLGISQVTPKLLSTIPSHTHPQISPSQHAIIAPLLRLYAFYLSRQYPDKASWIQRIVGAVLAVFVACLFAVQVDAQTAEQMALFQQFEARYQIPQGLLMQIADYESQFNRILPILAIHAPQDACTKNELHELEMIFAGTSTRIDDVRTNYMCAMGLMQWRPESWGRWAQDGDGDGERNPLSDADAIASTAYFLADRTARWGLKTALRKYTGNAEYATTLFSQYQQFSRR